MTKKEEIINLLLSTKRKGIENLIKYLNVSDFFTAPASTKHHGNYAGALAEHSLNVTNLLIEKNRRYNLGLSEASCIIAGICHDFCKIHLYVKTDVPTGKPCEFKEVYISKDSFPIGHGEKSIIIAQKFINLSAKEIMLIRWHMGSFTSKDDLYYYNKATDRIPAIVAMHTADYEASTFLEHKKE